MTTFQDPPPQSRRAEMASAGASVVFQKLMAHGGPDGLKVAQALAVFLRQGGSLGDDRSKIALDSIGDAA